jgi:hypothetical protein
MQKSQKLIAELPLMVAWLFYLGEEVNQTGELTPTTLIEIRSDKADESALTHH